MTTMTGDENTFADCTPSELVTRLVENYDDRRRLTARLDELENEALDLRDALAPAFESWEGTRVLVGRDLDPRLLWIQKTVNGGIAVSIHNLTRAEELHFPSRPSIALLDGTRAPEGTADLGLIDTETA